MSTITVNLGDSVTEAEENARSIASQLYQAWPIGDPRGQAGKNAFVGKFLTLSPRAQMMAKEILGHGTRKPVDEEASEPEIEEEEENSCCKCCR